MKQNVHAMPMKRYLFLRNIISYSMKYKLFFRRVFFLLVITLIPLSSWAVKGHKMDDGSRTLLNKGDVFYVDDIAYIVTYPVPFIVIGDETHTGDVGYVHVCARNYSGEVVIPKEVVYGGFTYNVTGITRYAFQDCTALTSVTIPESVKEIGNCAFSGCIGLEKAEFTSIESLFNISYDGGESNPLYYADYLYINGEKVTDVVIPNGIARIPAYTFCSYSGLTSVTIPESVKGIEDFAFYDCTGLTSVTIPESVKSIGDFAFLDCTGLTSVTLNSNTIVSEDYEYSLSNNIVNKFGLQVKEYILGEGVQSIGSRAFSGAMNLCSLTILANDVLFYSGYKFENVPLESVTLRVHISVLNAYRADRGWGKFGNIVSVEPLNGTFYVKSKSGKYMAAGHDWGTRGIVNEAGLDLIAVVSDDGKVAFDTRVDNWGNHYLGSDLYMDAPSYAWIVEKTGEDTYSIGNGTQYISVDSEDNLVMSNTPVNWQFVPEETVKAERMASLSAATENSPVDVTWMLGNPNFNRNDQRVSAWQVSEDCTNKNLNGGNNLNNCAESYHSTFTISQTLNDIPSGTYVMTAQGFYRQDEGATEDAPVFFLGTQTQSLDEMGVLPDANDNGQNDMNDASVAFSEGAYTIEPIYFYVEEGKSLMLGVRGTSKKQWAIFDNFRLMYMGSGMMVDVWESMKLEAETLAADDEAVAVGLLRDVLDVAKTVSVPTDEDRAALQAAIDKFTQDNADLEIGQTAKARYAQSKAEMRALLDDADALYNDEQNTNGKEELRQALLTAQEVLESNRVNIPEVEAAIDALKGAVQTFKTANGADETWIALKSEAEMLAADNEAVAVGLLRDALDVAKTVFIPTDEDRAALQAAIDKFSENNGDVESDQTAKVAVDGWYKFESTTEKAGVCEAQYAPVISTYDGRINVNLRENYETTTATIGQVIYQDITGLPNGTYKVGFYANAFYTSGRGFSSNMTDGAGDVAYVFANDQYEFIEANIATSTTENNFCQFDVEVTDGTIKLGMGKMLGGTNWHTMQIYQLTWFATAKTVYAADKNDMQTLIDEAKVLKENQYKVNGKEVFSAAITTAQNALANNRLNIAEFEAEIATLRAAIEAFKTANHAELNGIYYVKSAEGKFMAAGHDWGTRGIVNEAGLDLIAVVSDDGKVAFDTRVDNWGNHYLGSDLYMDAPSYAWIVEKTGEDTYSIGNGTQYISVDSEDNLVMSNTPVNWQFVPEETVKAERMASLSAATENSPVDVTWMLGNPNFNRNDQRVSAWQVSEDCTNKNLNGGNNVNNCAESFHSTFTISQTLSDIPAGIYELTAQGFYSQNKDNNDNDIIEDVPIFFIGDATKEVPVTTGSETSMSDASESFTNGKYTIEPIRFYVDDSKTLTVGIKGTALYQWVIFDNFLLKYLGSEDVTGVETLNEFILPDSATDAPIYDLNGRKLSKKPANGYYIQGGRKYRVK